MADWHIKSIMLKKQIESLLFVSPKPLAIKEMAKLAAVEPAAIKEALNALADDYRGESRGIRLLSVNEKYQLATDGDSAEIIDRFVKGEISGELTRPSLETLTVVAYRGPISKAELELIRGVNCSLILRNLLMRGLIEATEDKKRQTAVYAVTHLFLKHLGLSRVEDLPDFAKLNRHRNLDKLIGVEPAEPTEQ